MTERLVTVDNLGAWLVKCNADVSDVSKWVAGDRIGRWCVRRSYRTALMAPGQPVLLWVGGGRGRVARGIWGVGRLASAARCEPVAAGGPVGRSWYVELDLRLLAEPDRARRERLLADPRLADLEVFRQPQSANPSFVNRSQLAAITDHVAWPPA